MKEAVLIVDNRKEQAFKNKRILENANAEVFQASNLFDARCALTEKEPDLVIISDSLDENISAFIKEIRSNNKNLRPFIIVLSK